MVVGIHRVQFAKLSRKTEAEFGEQFAIVANKFTKHFENEMRKLQTEKMKASNTRTSV